MKILIATDGTKYGDAAVETVAALNLNHGDEIKVITVVDMAIPFTVDIYGGYLPDTTELERNAKESASKIVASAAARVNEVCAQKGVFITSDVLFGSPDGIIVETAEEMKADLIILGSHGYKQWERLLLGSVSSSVVHHAHCSVMVVRSPTEE